MVQIKKSIILGLSFIPTLLSAQSIQGTRYMLPMNGMRFTVKVEKTSYTPGKFCQYAERYMKQSVPQDGSTTYRIIGITMDPTAEPDTSKQFTLELNKKITIDKVTCSPSGQLLAINTDAKPAKDPVREFKPGTRQVILNPADFMTEDILNAGSTAKMAELTAKEIYDIRDSRNSLSRGEADNLPKDGAQLKLMYENMNRQEKALSSLFEGVTVKDTTWTQIDFMPYKEGKTALFRFSKYYGLVDGKDLSGTPYYLTVKDNHTAVEPTAEEEKKEDKDDIGLRVSLPSKITATLSTNGKEIDSYTINAAQFGFVQSLSGDLFNKKQTSQIVLDPLTGSIKTIKAIDLK